MKILKKLGSSILIGMILNLIVSDYYKYILNGNYKKYIDTLYIKYWPYGIWGWIIVGIILFFFIVETMLQFKKYEPNKKSFLNILGKIVLDELILFVILIIKWKDSSNIWWIYLNVGYWSTIAFLLLMIFHKTNNIKKIRRKSHRKEKVIKISMIKDKIISNLKTIWKKYTNEIVLFGKRISIFVANNEYILKRLMYALITSLVAAIVVSLWYSINFDDIQKSINNFLSLDTKLSTRASQMSSFVFACILDFLPLVLSTIIWSRIKKLKYKKSLLREYEYKKYGDINIRIEKAYFQIISLIICFLGLTCILFSLSSWGKARVLTLTMVVKLWFVLFGIAVFGIFLLSLLFDWLKKDSYQNNNLPRTTIFLGFVATMMAAFFK